MMEQKGLAFKRSCFMNNKRIMLTSASSDSGKTTFTMGFIRAFQKLNLSIASFKSGPDFIDPLFHREVLKIPSSNLDLFLMGKEGVLDCLMNKASDVDMVVMEGAMGYYDGIGDTTEASAYALSRVTETPAILIVNPKGMAASLGALVYGFINYKSDHQIRGIILNKTSPMMLDYYRKIVEPLGVPILGAIPFDESLVIESQRLGLETDWASEELLEKADRMAELIEKHVNMEKVLEIADTTPLRGEVQSTSKDKNLRVAIAKDKAFFFYYEDTLSSLSKMGIEWVPFSPLSDEKLPKDIHGIYIGGGYPEKYLEDLSKNTLLMEEIRSAYENKIPLYAEGGGFVYLHKSYNDGENIFPLVDVIHGSVTRGERLTRFGYVNMEAKGDYLFGESGEVIQAHEFHYDVSDNYGNGFIERKPLSTRSWEGVHINDHLYAGFPFLHLGSNRVACKRFIQKLTEYKERKNG